MVDFLLEIMSLAGAIGVYSAVGAGLLRVTAHCFTYSNYTEGPKYDAPGPVIAGIFWPIGLPILLPFFLWHFLNKVKLPSLPQRKKAEQKVLEYASSPTFVLVQMVCAKMIQNLHGFNIGMEKWDYNQNGAVIRVRYREYEGKCRSIISFNVGDKMIALPGKEKQMLCKTVNDCLKAIEDKEKADKEAANQLAALEAVEKLLLTPEKNND